MTDLAERGLSAEQRMMRESCRAFVDDFVTPFIRQHWQREWLMDPEARLPRAILEQADRIGIRTLGVPEEYGGVQLESAAEVRTFALIAEEIARGDSGLADKLVQNWKVSVLLRRFAPPHLQEKWFPRLVAEPSFLLAHCLTEPRGASDRWLPYNVPEAAMHTRAVREGDEWVINGRKWFSSNGSIADFLIVMAVTDPDAHRYQRASMFIVPVDTPGVRILRDVPTMEHPYERFGAYGGHAEIEYENVRVPRDALLGARGAGFLIAQQRLGPGRIHHCMRWLGVSRRAFDMLCERALSRYSHGSLLADKQTVQNWIADSAAEMHAARLMTLHAAWKMDSEGAAAARQEIALIKFFGAKVLHDVVDRALQAHGSLGYSTDLPLEQMYRFARAARLYDGPDEVHRQSVARQILRGYEAPEDGVPSQHVPTRRAAARERFADLLEAVTSND
jgi:acyl-CoA dehydrogenase